LIFQTEIFAQTWKGNDYASNSSVQLTHAERLLGNVALYGDEQILDVGCGDGKITALLAQKVPNGIVIGIDPSESMLTKAEERKAANLQFLQDSAENFRLDRQFDHIFSIHVMHWVKEQSKALKNIYLHLKPKGFVHFILAPSKEGLPFSRALKKTVDNWTKELEDFVNPQQVFDMESYRKLMVEAGFHIESMHYVYHESIHENKDKLRNWIKQWLPHGKHLTSEKRDLFLDELMSHYFAEMVLDNEMPVKWGEYVMVVEATKES